MARIADLLQDGPTRSFEFFPPKTDEMERQLDKTVAELALLSPSFVSVTYGALGSTRDRTRDVVLRINREQTFPCMAHLTCVGHTTDDIARLLDEYAGAGVENILALGGDPPADGSNAGGDYGYAFELVETVRAHEADFCIGVAAHPELHPRSADRRSDRRRLAEKLEAADFGVTQFFFDADDYFRMVDELDALGCRKPVLPGIMPILTIPGVKRMAAMNGTVIPPALLERLDAVEDDPDAIIDVGVEAATELCAQMIEAGAPGLHLYALNRPTSVRRIYDNLGLAPQS
jgi:methylenetetrahydrofolate reductase (NADPH)